jgi:hypothetical protein
MLIDAAAKAALNLPEALIPVQYSDFYLLNNNHIYSRWQQLWNTKTNNKVHGIEPNACCVPMTIRRKAERIFHQSSFSIVFRRLLHAAFFVHVS